MSGIHKNVVFYYFSITLFIQVATKIKICHQADVNYITADFQIHFAAL